jgi:bacillolysin
MKLRPVLHPLAAFGAFALILFANAGVQGQGLRPMAGSPIPSLTESGEQLTVVSVSAQTGHVTFAASPGRGILLPVESTATAETRALSFVDLYGKAFGLASSSQVRVTRAPEVDALGLEHVRMQQVHQGVPVRAAELLIHLKGSRVMVANGRVLDDLPANVVPFIPPDAARRAARQIIEKHQPQVAPGAEYGEPHLEIFNRALLSDTGLHRSRLAWFVEATGPMLREYIWIDAVSGAVLLNFSQLTDAKSRRVYNGGHLSALTGTLVRVEGGAATGDTDQDNAYTHAGITYDYFFSNHGRDSFDNAGGIIHSTAHHCAAGFPQGTTCPDYQNAFWNGQQMVYADGFSSADDVVAHELTHAITQYTANLLYYMQSGALNESFSDIFGETVDLLNGVGNDAANVRWKLGEDVPLGAIRDMKDPTVFFNPGKMSDSAFFVCNSNGWTDPNGDRGGVHSNSGIPNHAYALMVDGGTYNGVTVTGIGLTKAAKIQYRTLSVYLTSGSGFLENYNSLNQSCTDLIGTVGITATDCTQVQKALQAVEMNKTWNCPDGALAPTKCTSGMPTNIFQEGFEVPNANWIVSPNGSWSLIGDFVKSGVVAAYGPDPAFLSDHHITMATAVTVPTNGRMRFDHAFEFENGTFSYDGAVLEYSITNGASWIDAGSLIHAGRTYNGTIASGNALGGRSGFVDASSGYIATRLNLASLAGQNIKFRFRIGTDSSVGSLGWVIDNVSIYSCSSAAFTDNPLVANSTKIRAVHINELRTRIAALRLAKGLSVFAWTDPTLTANSTKVLPAHITDLRTALNAVYTASSVTPPTYTDVSLTGVKVKALHITQLRAAVIAIE